MIKEKLLKRLRYLYLLEFFNTLFLPFVFVINCYVRNEQVGINSIVVMTLNGFILLQGSYLWLKVSRHLRNNGSLSFIPTFKKLKLINIGLIIGTGLLLWFYPFKGTWDKYGSIIFFSLGILEYINYFHLQLIYDHKNDLKYLIKYQKIKKAKLKEFLVSSKN